jgi:hypothetical protein
VSVSACYLARVEATTEQSKAAERRLLDFSTEWMTIEQIGRADPWHDRRTAIFSIGWQTDLERIAEHLAQRGLLQRKVEGGITRYRRA